MTFLSHFPPLTSHFRSSWRWLALLPLLAVAAGCRSTGGAPTPRVNAIVQSQPTTAPARIDRYLAATRAGTWIYQRKEMRDNSSRPATPFLRRAGERGSMEGDTAWSLFRLFNRKTLESQGVHPLPPKEPPPSGTSGFALRFEVDTPTPLIPEGLEQFASDVRTTRLTYTNLEGSGGGQGELTRTATIEGFEDVEVPAGKFEQCLRVRVDLKIDIRWGLSIDLSMIVWISPEAGEVRRVQQLSGWVLIFPFGSTFEYELVSRTPPAQTQPADQPAPLWKEGIIAFDRGVPHPRLGILAIRYGETESGD